LEIYTWLQRVSVVVPWAELVKLFRYLVDFPQYSLETQGLRRCVVGF